MRAGAKKSDTSMLSVGGNSARKKDTPEITHAQRRFLSRILTQCAGSVGAGLKCSLGGRGRGTLGLENQAERSAEGEQTGVRTAEKVGTEATREIGERTDILDEELDKRGFAQRSSHNRTPEQKEGHTFSGGVAAIWRRLARRRGAPFLTQGSCRTVQVGGGLLCFSHVVVCVIVLFVRSVVCKQVVSS